MRKGEILALTWNSINWITQKITVDKNYTHCGLGTPKTGKIRVIDMSNELAKVLKEWRLACPHSELNLVQMGHYSIIITIDLYAHLLLEINAKCVNLLNNIVNTTFEINENIKRFGT